MRWEKYINADEVKRAVSVLHEPGQVFECRVVGTSKKDILSGYFRDADTMLGAFDTIDLRERNVYITLGEVKEECFSRAQSERFLRNPQTTSDTEIVRFRWLFVDLDPVRSAGISSSKQELKDAEDLAGEVYAYLQGMGFEAPVRALSGNGYHLLYRISLKNDKAGRALVEKCLKVLAMVFNSDKVKIDTTNSNPSRICKLHGTVAQKGASTPSRPHRMSRLLEVPEPVKITDAAILEKLAAELPDDPPDQGNRRRGYTQQEEFDLLGFMSRHGLTYSEDSNDRAKIYKLDECPFDHSHKNGDAKIFHYSNGAIAFKCHHNSCREYKWQDVRLMFEPDAYTRDESEDERIDAGYREHVRKKAEESASQSMTLEPQKPAKVRKIRKLKTAEALMEKNLPEPRVFVGVGAELPFLMEGTCILSAKPKLGKSWLALAMLLNIARGEPFLGYQTQQCSVLYLDLETSETLQQRRLRKILRGDKVPKNFYLDTETDAIGSGFVEQIEAYLKEDPDIGVVVIDVFQIIRSPSKNVKETEYEHAYRDITPLNELAQKHHISIVLVCHDRKAVDPDDPFSNILGSTGLQGAATQMVVMFRKRKDDPIHISVKGKTIDGLPELNVKLEDAQWSIVEGYDGPDQEQARLQMQYETSNIRKAVLALAEHNAIWKGKCAAIKNDAVQYGIGVIDEPREIGGFLHKHQGRFLEQDGVQIQIVNNGTAGKIYKISKFTIDTIDDIEGAPLIEFEKASNYADSDIPFL